jgi:hypothetical protein
MYSASCSTPNTSAAEHFCGYSRGATSQKRVKANITGVWSKARGTGHNVERLLRGVRDAYLFAAPEKAAPARIENTSRLLKVCPRELAVGKCPAWQSVILPPYEPALRRRKEMAEVIASPDHLVLAHSYYLIEACLAWHGMVPVFRRK